LHGTSQEKHVIHVFFYDTTHLLNKHGYAKLIGATIILRCLVRCKPYILFYGNHKILRCNRRGSKNNSECVCFCGNCCGCGLKKIILKKSLLLLLVHIKCVWLKLWFDFILSKIMAWYVWLKLWAGLVFYRKWLKKT
jgi:hypothetical protein